jgi:hypothetical protein
MSIIPPLGKKQRPDKEYRKMLRETKADPILTPEDVAGMQRLREDFGRISAVDASDLINSHEALREQLRETQATLDTIGTPEYVAGIEVEIRRLRDAIGAAANYLDDAMMMGSHHVEAQKILRRALAEIAKEGE